MKGELVKAGTLKVHDGAPHGIHRSYQDALDAEILDFIRVALSLPASTDNPTRLRREPETRLPAVPAACPLGVTAAESEADEPEDQKHDRDDPQQ